MSGWCANWVPAVEPNRVSGSREGKWASRFVFRITVFTLVMLVASSGLARGAPAEPPEYTAMLDTHAWFSSPVFADLNDDGRDEIILGTEGGHLVALKYNGDGFPAQPILWDTNLSAALGSSPTVADVDGDGDLEIAIGVGYNPMSQPGGIVLLDHAGNVLWRVTTKDRNGGPDGVPDGVFGTPTLADISGDGYLEVVVAGFDEELYVIDRFGNHLPGWPRHLRDGTWASPAVADLDQDGIIEIIVGAYYHDSPCPDKSCGMLFVFHPDGSDVPGWPKYLDFHIDSSPAVGDIDQDGDLEIVVGTGQVNDPRRLHRAVRVYAFEADGQYVAGWPKYTAGYVFSSPSLADIDGDGNMEVFVGDSEGYLYGWHHDGSSLPGWPVVPLNQNGNPQKLGSSPIVGDFDGDELFEVMIPVGWDIVGFNVDGTDMDYRLVTDYSIAGTPVIGDLDHDGYLEACIGGRRISDPAHGYVYVWELGQPASNDDVMNWPIWRARSRRDGWTNAMPSSLEVAPGELAIMHRIGAGDVVQRTLHVRNGGPGVLHWTAESTGGRVAVQPGSGTAYSDLETIDVEIDVGGLEVGAYDLGEITLTGSAYGQAVEGSPGAIPVTLYVVEAVERTFLPLVVTTGPAD